MATARTEAPEQDCPEDDLETFPERLELNEDEAELETWDEDESMDDEDARDEDFRDDLQLRAVEKVPVWRLIEMLRENRNLMRELSDFEEYDSDGPDEYLH